MYSSHKIKAAAATLVVGFLLAIAFTATAQAGGGLTAQQSKAVRARAQATDRFYHLGSYGTVAAEQRRGQAIDRYYHLGSYTVVASTNPFQWSDAGIGAGAMLGTILLLGGLAVVLRRRDKPSVPTTV